MPQIINEGEFNEQYIEQMTNYIDENIGFKQKAIEFNLAFMYKLFDKIDIGNYIKGKENNIFYTNNGYGTKVWQGELRFSEQQKKDFLELLVKFDTILKDSDTKLYLMGIPDKENIYPEYYPDDIVRFSEATQLDDLLGYVKDNSEVSILPIKEKLLEEKKVTNDYLYYKTYDSTHWNNKGAWVGYNILLDCIVEKFVDIKKVTEDKIEFIAEDCYTMEFLQKSELLKKVMFFPEKKYNIKIKNSIGYDTQKECPEGFDYQTGDIYFHYSNDAINNGKTLMIVGDSYMYISMLPLLAESFSDVYFIQTNKNEQAVALFNATKPDIFVYEFVERAFYYDVAIEFMNEFVSSNEEEN